METYRSSSYAPEKVARRYVSYTFEGFKFYDVDAKGYTIREGFIDEALIPEPERGKAKALYGYHPNQVIMSDDWRSPC